MAVSVCVIDGGFNPKKAAQRGLHPTACRPVYQAYSAGEQAVHWR